MRAVFPLDSVVSLKGEPVIDKSKKKQQIMPSMPSMPKSAMPKARTPDPTPAPTKSFSVGTWNNNDGEKVILYGDTGIGKTNLASMAPNAVFIGLDDGGRKLANPITGERLQYVQGVTTYADVRSALQNYSMYDDFKTVVIDTATVLQDLASEYVVMTIPAGKDSRAVNIHSYGYNKGFDHLYDAMKAILADCDELVRRGKNIIIICQSLPNRISNPGGEDYLREGPRLYVGKPSIEALYCEWADHIFRIDYHDAFVKDKKIAGATERAIYTQPELYFRAKSRTLGDDAAVVSYNSRDNDSIWRFLFPQEYKETE